MIINPYSVSPAGPQPVLDLEADAGISVSDGSGIPTWVDQSASGNNATQGTGASQPTYRATLGPGGRPTVEFDGSADNFQLAATLPLAPFTFLAVIQPASSMATPRPIIGSGTLATPEWRMWQNKQNFLKSNTTDLGSSTSTVSTAAFSLVGMSWSGTLLEFRLAGVADGSISVSSSIIFPDDRIGFAGTGSGNEFYATYISAIRVYNVVLTSTQWDAADAILKTRWGL